MQARRDGAAALGASLAWGGAGGALLHLGASSLGASPGALTGLTAAALLGGGLGLLVTPRSGRRGERAWAALALTLALSAGWLLPWAWPWPLLPVALVGAGFTRALPSARGAPVAMLGAFALLAGFHQPVAGCALAAFGMAADFRREPFRTPARPRSASSYRGSIAVGAAVWMSTAAWTATRPALDPTPAGWANVVAAWCLLAGAGMLIGRLGARLLLPAVGAAALASYAGTALVPGAAWQVLAPLAGEADPRRSATLLAVAGIAAGGLVGGLGAAGLGSRSARAAGFIAAGVGCALGPAAGTASGDALLLLAAACGLAGVLRGPGGWLRLAGVVVLSASAAAPVALGWPEVQLVEGRFAHLRDANAPDEAIEGFSRSTRLAGGWGPEGSTLLVRQTDGTLQLHLDGLPRAVDDRLSEAASLAGHLAAALADRRDRALLLGDETGRALEATLAQGVGSVEVAVPNAGAVRALVAHDKRAEQAHFRPEVRHRRGPLAWTLRTTAPVDVLVEVVAAPWWDTHMQLPGSAQLDLRARHLAPGGVYALVVPALWLGADELATITRAFSSTFAWSVLALPPVGLDQVLLLGRVEASAPPWERIESASERGASELGRLGLGTPWALAGRFAVGSSGLADLPGEHAAMGPGLLSALHRRPRLHASLLRPHLIEPFEVLSAVPDSARASLAGNRDSHDRLFDFYGHVGRGEVPELAEDARALEGTANERALDELVRPMTDAARRSIERGFAEGPGSTAWDRCVAELTQAQLFHAASAEVLALLGECYLQKGNLPRAARLLDQALATDPYGLETLLTAARVALARGEEGVAEAHLQAASTRHALDWRGHYDLGRLYVDMGRLDEAEAELRQAAARAEQETHLPWLALAHLELRRNHPDRAVTHAERAVERAPDHPDARYVRGRAYFELAQYEQAQRDFRDVVLEHPEHCEARIGLGMVAAIRGDYASAVDSFKRAVACDPGSVPARQALEAAQAELPAP